MSTGSAIKAGQAFIEVFADDSKLNRTLKRVEKRLTNFGSVVRDIGKWVFGVGAAIIGGFLTAGKAAESLGSQLDDMSQRTGASVESLSELSYAAQLSGTDIESLEGSMKKMQKGIADAVGGSKEAEEAFNAIGLSAKQLQHLSPDEQFMAIAKGMERIQNPTARAAMAMKIFGKSGTDLLPLLNQGAAGIAKMRQEAQDLGLVMSTQDAQAAAEWGDQLDTLKMSLKGTLINVGLAVLPIIKQITGVMIQATTAVIKWVKDNRGLITSAAKIAITIAAAGAAIFAVGAGIAAVGAVIGGIATVFGTVAAVITGIAGAVTTVVGLIMSGFAAAGAVIAAFLTPIGLVIGVVVALAGAFVYASGVFDGVLEDIQAGFKSLLKDSLESFAGIRDALAGGDIALAGQILWTTLKMEWQKGVLWLEERWLKFKNFFLDVGTEASATIASVFIDAWAGLQQAWASFIGFMSSAWTKLSSSFTKTMRNTSGSIAKALISAQELAGIISKEDAEEQRKNVDDANEHLDKTGDATANQALADQAKETAQRKAAIEEERKQQHDSHREGVDAEINSRKGEGDATMQAMRDELKKTQDQLKGQIKKAKDEATGAAVENAPGETKPKPKLFGDLEMPTKDVSTVGTFSANAVRGIAGGGVERKLDLLKTVLDKISESSDAIAENTGAAQTWKV